MAFVGESGLTGETPVLGVPIWCRVGDGVGWKAWKLGYGGVVVWSPRWGRGKGERKEDTDSRSPGCLTETGGEGRSRSLLLHFSEALPPQRPVHVYFAGLPLCHLGCFLNFSGVICHSRWTTANSISCPEDSSSGV